MGSEMCIRDSTLADLQRYDWKVPFPDDSGTIKIERGTYVIKEL